MNGGFGKKEVWPLQCIFSLRKQELLFFLNEQISSSDFESNSLILHKVCSKPNIVFLQDRSHPYWVGSINH